MNNPKIIDISTSDKFSEAMIRLKTPEDIYRERRRRLREKLEAEVAERRRKRELRKEALRQYELYRQDVCSKLDIEKRNYDYLKRKITILNNVYKTYYDDKVSAENKEYISNKYIEICKDIEKKITKYIKKRGFHCYLHISHTGAELYIRGSKELTADNYKEGLRI